MSAFIAGEWVSGEGERISSINPVSGSEIWTGTAATAFTVDRAVAAAHTAFPSWASTSWDHRTDLVRAFAALVDQRSEELARLVTDEVGKPLWDARSEVGAVVAKVQHSINAHLDRAGVTERDAGDIRSVTRHKPHGVMAVFGPYNFPAHLPNGHIVPALLAGNTIVFKPSELTPAVGALLVELYDEAGLPPGTINLVQGARETGAALARSAIDGLLFTGSAATGAILHEQFGGRPEVLLALEMGGNNPVIVIEGAEVEAAVGTVIQSAFLTTGQRCTCARRLFVPDGQYGDQFVEHLVGAAAELNIGDPADEEHPPFMGSLVSAQAADRMLAAQASLVDAGAQLLLEMRRPPDLSRAFVTPGIVDVTNVDVPDEEHFGPLLQVTRYGSLSDAVDAANDTRFGLAAGVIGGDRETYQRLWFELRAGIVNWNRPTTGASSASPFGGIGASGNHRPAAYYAADYSSYPVASLESDTLVTPTPLPGQ